MYLFQDLKKAASKMDFKSAKEAREWYRQQALKVLKVDREKVMNTAEPFKIFQDVGVSRLEEHTSELQSH